MTFASIFDDIKTGIRIALLSVYHGITQIKLLGFLFIFTALFLAIGISPFFFEPITDIKELTPVMQYVSHQLHLFAGVVSLVSLATSFLILRSSIKTISTHKE